ncbi:LysR family transcriptional regulator [Pikeienuella sp. HZG-20]|uniref:LysR family transcriptional regulator n=1 Tax=Paludibacillus litoralis TaxID=3133267 RepID=UPI0030EF72FB
MISLKQIRYFVAAAETQQISAAAVSLGISQSAVTVAIKGLESQLGVTLIRRRVGGVALTQDGVKFLQHARNIEASIADSILSMKNRESSVKGRIRFGVTYTGVGYFLLPALARFRRAYPDITIDLIEMERPALEQAVRRGAVDLALIIVSNLSEAHLLNVQMLMRSPRVLWLSSAHPLNKRSEISLQDLRSEPFVQFTSDEAPVSARRYLADIGFDPNVILRTTSMEAVRGMVATGGAITILASLVYRPWSLDGGRVEIRKLSEPIPTLDLGVVWSAERPISEAERKLVDHLKAAGAGLDIGVEPGAPPGRSPVAP